MTDFPISSSRSSLLNPSQGSILARANISPVLSPSQARADAFVGTVLSQASDWRTIALAAAAPGLLAGSRRFVATGRAAFAVEAAAPRAVGVFSAFSRTGAGILMGASALVAGCSGEDSMPNVPEAHSFTPVGSEFPLSAASSIGTSQGLRLALNGGGSMVAASADFNPGTSGGTGVFARAFSGDTPGAVVTVDQPTGGVDVNPSVSTNSGGNFVISWMTTTAPETSTLHARRFDNTGRPIGATLSLGDSTDPFSSVVLFDDGGFAVVTRSGGRIFNADNSPAGTLSNPNPGDSSAFAVGTTPQGQWAWAAIVPGSGSSSDVYFQRMNGRSGGESDHFSIGSLGTAAAVRVGTLSNGPSLIAWQTNSGIRGQIVDNGGTPLDDPFTIASVPPGGSFSVSGDNHGSFVVAWDEGNQIKATVYSGEGRALFSNLDVSGSSGENHDAVVTANGDGRVSIGWRRFSTSGGSAHYDLVARNYQIAY